MPALSYIISVIIDLGRLLDDHSGTISAISTAFVAAFTYTLWRATTRLWESSKTHATHLENSIAHAGRSAIAMERVAESLAQTVASAAENTKIVREMSERQREFAITQMRAYLAVGFGGLVLQDRKTDYKFEVRMTLTNMGNTPAHDVSYRARAAVLPNPLPFDFPFALPDIPVDSAGVLNTRQPFAMGAIVDRMYSDDEIKELSAGLHSRIYIYGTVTYADIFGEPRYVNFSQRIEWLKGGQYMGFNTRRYNDSN